MFCLLANTPYCVKGVTRVQLPGHRPSTLRRIERRRTYRVGASSSPSNDSAKTTVSLDPKSTKQYAVLHDFCMSIPYGVIATLVGLIGLTTGKGTWTAGVLLAGVAICASSALSLRAWRTGQNNRRYTLTAAGLSLGVSALTWRLMQKAKTSGGAFMSIFLAMSVAMVVFLIYNVGAGGNPPKRHP